MDRPIGNVNRIHKLLGVLIRIMYSYHLNILFPLRGRKKEIKQKNHENRQNKKNPVLGTEWSQFFMYFV